MVPEAARGDDGRVQHQVERGAKVHFQLPRRHGARQHAKIRVVRAPSRKGFWQKFDKSAKTHLFRRKKVNFRDSELILAQNLTNLLASLSVEINPCGYSDQLFVNLILCKNWMSAAKLKSRSETLRLNISNFDIWREASLRDFSLAALIQFLQRINWTTNLSL